MAKYSNSISPKQAAAQFNGKAGTYIAHFANGEAYSGRQSKGGRRISTHARKHADLIGVQFMHDHGDNPCVRAKRETQAVTKLKKTGTRVRNKIKPSTPKACIASKPRTKKQPPKTKTKKSKVGAMLVGVGVFGLLLLASAKKSR